MARPTTKAQLLEAAESEFTKLMNLLENVDSASHTRSGVNGEWSVKDVLAHLFVWHQMMETWYTDGMAGNKPQIPAPGYTWKTTPQLNEKIFQEHRLDAYESVFETLKATHQRMLALIANHSNDELFTKQKYAWTGTTSLGAYFVSATSSHYVWAADLIKKCQKSTFH
jgi:hypothetical protein